MWSGGATPEHVHRSCSVADAAPFFIPHSPLRIPQSCSAKATQDTSDIRNQKSFALSGRSPTRGMAYLMKLAVTPLPPLLMNLRGMFLIRLATSFNSART